MDSPSRSYANRVLSAVMKRRGLDRIALAALRKATQLLGLAIGTRLAQMPEEGSPVQVLCSRAEQDALHLRLLQETIEILASRWDKVPDRHRPHYTPEQCYRILRIRDLLALSREETATTFRVSNTTIDRWDRESATDSDATTVGSLVQPSPPVRRYADVRTPRGPMSLCGFGGCDLIARILARAGWKISSRTVGRVRKEKPTPAPLAERPFASRGVVARYPNHVWMADLTEIPGFFRIFSFKLALLFDAFSRMPLAAKLFDQEPPAGDLAALLEVAAQRNGTTARHSVSDKGSQFAAELFQTTLARLGIKHRFGAVGRTGSIALIERLWRTLKDILRLRTLKPLVLKDLQRRLDLGLLHYAYQRPHQALDGATPAEIYFGIRPAHLAAVHPPRGGPGEGSPDPPFQIAYLDTERLLPFLVPKAA